MPSVPKYIFFGSARSSCPFFYAASLKRAKLSHTVSVYRINLTSPHTVSTYAFYPPWWDAVFTYPRPDTVSTYRVNLPYLHTASDYRTHVLCQPTVPQYCIDLTSTYASLQGWSKFRAWFLAGDFRKECLFALFDCSYLVKENREQSCNFKFQTKPLVTYICWNFPKLPHLLD